ncbi:hypothetical protein [Mesorhizobium sp. L103C131B0]|uniref:hypothetical protein n=1 Tax=Mesorhizobium sp. L103C131B0 TaxID=1287089 RepID=UPI0012DD2DF5|nr:hypothetical protein [Mesorhizobium sp. L103C131B0]
MLDRFVLGIVTFLALMKPIDSNADVVNPIVIYPQVVSVGTTSDNPRKISSYALIIAENSEIFNCMFWIDNLHLPQQMPAIICNKNGSLLSNAQPNFSYSTNPGTVANLGSGVRSSNVVWGTQRNIATQQIEVSACYVMITTTAIAPVCAATSFR